MILWSFEGAENVFALLTVRALLETHWVPACLSKTSVGATEPWIDTSITAGPALQTSGPL